MPQSSTQYRSRFKSYNRKSTFKRRPSTIDASKYVRKARPLEVNEYTPQHTFADFAVADVIARNLAASGYTKPTPIQDQTIIPALAGQDIIGIANTGTGKTAAFGIPVLNSLMNDKDSSALIIAPTRELAQQINEAFRAIAKGSGLAAVLLIGGTSMGPQLSGLRGRPQVVIGTPGRILDHLDRGSLSLETCKYIVLDEVDRMLDMGFVADVESILQEIPAGRQSYFFSATMDTRVRGLIEGFAKDPLIVSLKTSDGSENVDQDIVRYSSPIDKLDKLHSLLIDEKVKAIIFDETQRNVERLNQELVARGFSSDAIHGGKTQGQRERALDKFRKNNINILVATDVAARGIDIVDITHVINYTQPQSYADYVHRIGRAGRAGRTGTALTFIQ
jgi:superfamily II DNA/RNA helicase